MSLRILSVGLSKGTTRHRENALRELGHDVTGIASDPPGGFLKRQIYRAAHRLRRHLDLVGTNRAVRETLDERAFDVLWVDKGLTISPSTLVWAKRRLPRISLVSYSPDDMFSSDLQSTRYRAGIPLYDLHVTTKSFNVDELPTLGARDVLFVNNAYDRVSHRPIELTESDRRRFSAPVGFVGTYEPERARVMLRMARDAIRVRIHGYGWHRMREHHPNLQITESQLLGIDYSKAINATDVNLAFLRKAYRDLQTTRSIEIPACGAFMLAERTSEHLELFEEGIEAEFFASYDELLSKCRDYILDPDKRMQVAAAGRARCLSDGYDNASVLGRVIEHLEERRG